MPICYNALCSICIHCYNCNQSYKIKCCLLKVPCRNSIQKVTLLENGFSIMNSFLYLPGHRECQPPNNNHMVCPNNQVWLLCFLLHGPLMIYDNCVGWLWTRAGWSSWVAMGMGCPWLPLENRSLWLHIIWFWQNFWW